MDYFTLFVPARYRIDTRALSLRFQDLQRQYRDKFANGARRSSLPPSSNRRSTRAGKRCVTL